MNRAEKRRQQKLAKKAQKKPPHQRSIAKNQTLSIAMQHHSAGRLSEAESLYQRMLQAEPDQPDALHLLGVISHQVGKNNTAVDYISRALAIQPDHAEAHMNLGNALQALDRFDEAEFSYKKALAIKPVSAEAHYNLANLLQAQGKLEDAMANYHKALALKPDYAKAYYNLGNALQALGEHRQAVSCYSKAVAITPAYPEAHNNLGNSLQALERLEEAVSTYTKAFAIKPDYAEAHNNLGNVLQMLGKFDEAVVSYDKAISINPEYAEAHNNLGNALQALGTLDKALSNYNKAIALSPENAEAYKNTGNVLQALGKFDEAVAHYHKALAIRPDYAEAHNNLGNVLQALGRLDEAVSSYDRSLAANPEYAEAHNNSGLVLQALGKLDQARTSFTRALSIKPDYAEAHHHRAGLHKFTEYDDDIRCMERIFSGPTITDTQKMHLAFGLGKAFEDLQQYEKAFDFIVEGNRIRRSTYKYSKEDEAQYFERIKEAFDASFFAGHKPTGYDEVTPPIFILGMPRSGTSLVEQILASHPQVYGAGELEVLRRLFLNYFNGEKRIEISNTPHQVFGADFESTGLKYTQESRKQSRRGQLVTDKMPGNFQYIGFIKRILPNAKVIHCKRNPADTCLSIFKNHFITHHPYSNDLEELGHYYNLYTDLMEHWHCVLPGFVHDLHYEDLIKDQAGQTGALLEYCGLEWDDACLAFHNSNRPVATASAAQVRRPIYTSSVQLWKMYEDQLSPLLEILH